MNIITVSAAKRIAMALLIIPQNGRSQAQAQVAIVMHCLPLFTS